MILFTTDIHLDHVRGRDSATAFGQRLMAEYPEAKALIVTGDIAESATIEVYLTQFAKSVMCPVYWITGNHDYYGGSLHETHTRLASITAPNLVWLDSAAPVLFEDFALVGKFAWYDALYGDPQNSDVILHDFTSIAEFRAVFNEFEWTFMRHNGARNPLLTRLRQLASLAVAEVRPKLEQALELRQHVVFATHVAPFDRASWHLGKMSGKDWLPWFTCRQMGDMLAEVASRHLDHKILVLCGHSHSPGVYQHAPNLKVLTGRAEYGHPDVAALLISPFDDWTG